MKELFDGFFNTLALFIMLGFVYFFFYFFSLTIPERQFVTTCPIQYCESIYHLLKADVNANATQQAFVMTPIRQEALREALKDPNNPTNAYIIKEFQGR